METRGILIKILAVAGTILVWLPILAPVLFAALRLIESSRLQFDYLMPAELFPLALAGGLLLVWAAWRRRSRRGLIGWSFVMAIVLLVGGMVLAAVTGLASGEREASGPWLALVLAPLIGYSLALAATGVGGYLLLLDLFRKPGGAGSSLSAPTDQPDDP